MFRFVRWHRGASGPPQCLSVTSFNGDFGVRQLRCWRHRGEEQGGEEEGGNTMLPSDWLGHAFTLSFL